jgi:hypothetical protein
VQAAPGEDGAQGGRRVSLEAVLAVPVRAMVRAEADRGKLPAGVEVAVADFDAPASIAAALRGAGRAYLVTPSSERAEAQQRRFADLAAQTGVGHLVVLSQLGADEQSPVRFLRYHAAVERHIRNLGAGYTFLRPNLFFQGLLAFAGTIVADGRFFAPIGDAAISAVDVRDIAAVAATALGRDITFVDVSSDAFAESLQGILPPWQIQGLLEDYAHYRRRGGSVRLPRGRRDHRQAPNRRHAFRPRLRPGVRRLRPAAGAPGPTRPRSHRGPAGQDGLGAASP